MTLGEYIKSARKEKGYTQTTLAQELGDLDYRMVQRWESDGQVPHPRYLIKMIKILNLNIDVLENLLEKK